MATASMFTKMAASEMFSLNKLESLDESSINKIIECLNKAKFPIKNFKKNEIEKLINENFNDEYQDIISDLISSILFSLRICDSQKEISKFIKSTTEELKGNSKDRFQLILNSLEYIDVYYDHRRLERYKTRAVNYYRRMRYSCSMIGRFAEDYEYRNMQVEDYTPEIIDAVPMVSLCFFIGDNEIDKATIFSLDEEELNEVISNLIAAQKELKILKNFSNK